MSHDPRSRVSRRQVVAQLLTGASAALLAGCEMQALVQQHPTRQARDVSIRIGLHFGSPITAGVAAQRVALLAGSGQIFTTGETLESLSPQQREMIRKLELPSRAKSHSITVYEVIWHTSRIAAASPAAGDLSRPRNPSRHQDHHRASPRSRHRTQRSKRLARSCLHRAPYRQVRAGGPQFARNFH